MSQGTLVQGAQRASNEPEVSIESESPATSQVSHEPAMSQGGSNPSESLQ